MSGNHTWWDCLLPGLAYTRIPDVETYDGYKSIRRDSHHATRCNPLSDSTTELTFATREHGESGCKIPRDRHKSSE